MLGARVAFLTAWALVGNSQTLNPFKIAGHVVESTDHRPVHGAVVNITMVDKPSQEASVTTGQNGEFLFRGLPPGKYTLTVNQHGQPRAYRQWENYSTSIAVGNGVESEHILFLVETPARISGAVLDEESEPVRGAAAFLFSEGVEEGKRRTSMKEMATTDSDGRFRFHYLQPGTYYLAIYGRPWYAQYPTASYVEGQMAVSQINPELNVAFPVTYYDGGFSPESAAPLKLVEGQKAEIEIRLRAVPAFQLLFDGSKISANVEHMGPGGQPIQLSLNGSPSGLSGVPTGSYIVAAFRSNGNEVTPLAPQTISVTGDSTLQFTEATGAIVRGTVSMSGGLPADLEVLLMDGSQGNNLAVPVGKDGKFSFPPLGEGRYAVRLANNPEVYVQKVTATGGAFAGGELEVTAGAQINLALQVASGVTKLSGLAIARGSDQSKAVPGAMVLLIPQDGGYSNYIPRDQSDSDGTFTLNWVAPGRYTLVAIDDGRGLAYAEPAVIKPYLEHGQLLESPLPKDTTLTVEVQHRQ